LQLTLSFRLIWMFYCFYFLSSTSKKQCIASSSFPKALQYFYQKKLFRPRFVNPSCMPSLLILPQNIKWTHSKNTIFYYMAVATNYFTMITKWLQIIWYGCRQTYPPPTYLPTHQPTYLLTHPSTHPPTYLLRTCLHTHLFTFPFTH
jgi:hypothetical protein